MTEDDVLFTYRAEVLRILDGDTTDMKVHLGFGLTVQPGAGFTLGRFRLWGINAPELHGPDQLAAFKARDALHDILLPAIGPLPPIAWIQSRRPEKFGRWLALVWTRIEDVGNQEKSVNAGMLRGGFAKPYADEPLVLMP